MKRKRNPERLDVSLSFKIRYGDEPNEELVFLDERPVKMVGSVFRYRDRAMRFTSKALVKAALVQPALAKTATTTTAKVATRGAKVASKGAQAAGRGAKVAGAGVKLAGKGFTAASRLKNKLAGTPEPDPVPEPKAARKLRRKVKRRDDAAAETPRSRRNKPKKFK